MNESSNIHRSVLENFLDTYLVERDLKKTMSLVTDDVYSIGTGAQEVARNKEELYKLVEDEISQITGTISYELNYYHEKKVSDNAFVALCNLTATYKMGSCNIHFTTRLTAGFRLEDGKYLVYHVHMSEPSAIQESHEFFPVHYGISQVVNIDEEDQIGLIELMKKTIPGGVIGSYAEEGFPLYFINDELLNLLGYTYEEFIDDNGEMTINTVHPEDSKKIEKEVLEKLKENNEYKVEYRMKKKDGSYIWVRDTGRKTVNPDGRTAMIRLVTDITNEIKVQASFDKAIESMKTERRRVDRMTGLLNREPAEAAIEKELLLNKKGAFFFMDIDNFKLVNDLKGHPEGDKVLKRFGEILQCVFQEKGVIARLGGDEFVVFVTEYEDMDTLKGLADGILIQAAFLIDDEMLASKLGVSIGIAMAPEDGDTFNMLYANADKAQYFSKRNGKNRYSFYNQSETTTIPKVERANIETLTRMLQNTFIDAGAFSVEFEAFNKIYQFIERNIQRMEQSTQILLFALRADRGDMEEEEFNRQRKILESCIKYRLRSGDLMMDFSANQIAVLLVNCDTENGNLVASRIEESYREEAGDNATDVAYEIYGIKGVGIEI